MKEYIPNPVETSNLSLPSDLLPLVEDIAKKVHEVWAQNRKMMAGPTARSVTIPRRHIHV